MNATTPFLCECKINGQNIVFCPLHKAAESLLAAVDYSKKMMAGFKYADAKDETLVNQVVLPYLDSVLALAQKRET